MRERPSVRISLMLDATEGNDPFYRKMTEDCLVAVNQRHRLFPFWKPMRHGVALQRLSASGDEYFAEIEAAARRNCKKARRNGYVFQRITYNDHLEDMRKIWMSTEVRQGRVPDNIRSGKVEPCNDPPSRNATHDYAYFGVLKDGVLVAYAGCMIAGEVCMIEQIFGHAEHQPNGVVPLLLFGIVDHLLANHKTVKYFGYGTYFGAGETLKRFKRKFGFRPHIVDWRG